MCVVFHFDHALAFSAIVTTRAISVIPFCFFTKFLMFSSPPIFLMFSKFLLTYSLFQFLIYVNKLLQLYFICYHTFKYCTVSMAHGYGLSVAPPNKL